MVRWRATEGRCARCDYNATANCRHLKLHLLSAISMLCEAMFSFVYHTCPRDSVFEFDVSFNANMHWILIADIQSKVMPKTNVFTIQSVFISLTAFSVYCAVEEVLPESVYIKMFGVVSVVIVAMKILDEPTKDFLRRKPACGVWDASGSIGRLVLVSPVLFLAPLLHILFEPKMWTLLVLHVAAIGSSGYYFVWKRKRHEVIYRRTYLLAALCVILFVPSFVLYKFSPTRRSLPGRISRSYNSDCLLPSLDAHDLWHILSASTWLFSVSAVFYADDGLYPSYARPL